MHKKKTSLIPLISSGEFDTNDPTALNSSAFNHSLPAELHAANTPKKLTRRYINKDRCMIQEFPLNMDERMEWVLTSTLISGFRSPFSNTCLKYKAADPFLILTILILLYILMYDLCLLRVYAAAGRLSNRVLVSAFLW
jgi:hypothetical protein